MKPERSQSKVISVAWHKVPNIWILYYVFEIEAEFPKQPAMGVQVSLTT